MRALYSAQELYETSVTRTEHSRVHIVMPAHCNTSMARHIPGHAQPCDDADHTRLATSPKQTTGHASIHRKLLKSERP